MTISVRIILSLKICFRIWLTLKYIANFPPVWKTRNMAIFASVWSMFTQSPSPHAALWRISGWRSKCKFMHISSVYSFIYIETFAIFTDLGARTIQMSFLLLSPLLWTSNLKIFLEESDTPYIMVSQLIIDICRKDYIRNFIVMIGVYRLDPHKRNVSVVNTNLIYYETVNWGEEIHTRHSLDKIDVTPAVEFPCMFKACG